MRFHYPSFKQYFEGKFDDSFNLYNHNWRYHVIPPNKYFSTSLLQELVTEALIESLESPVDPLNSAQHRSLFVAPPVAHVEALQKAMLDRTDYIEKGAILTGVGERIEYRIDLQIIQYLVIEIRREQDVEMALQILPGEIWVSDRGLEERIYRMYGRRFSNRRCRDILHALEEQGVIKNNGKLRTFGREVLI